MTPSLYPIARELLVRCRIDTPNECWYFRNAIRIMFTPNGPGTLKMETYNPSTFRAPL